MLCGSIILSPQAIKDKTKYGNLMKSYVCQRTGRTSDIKAHSEKYLYGHGDTGNLSNGVG